jgi:hypothetical protein
VAPSPSWIEKRKRIRRDITLAFSGRTAISGDDFQAVFYDPESPAPIGDFHSQYLPSEAVLAEIFEELGESTGLEPERIASYYRRDESFPQFGEHVLRAGAYEE